MVFLNFDVGASIAFGVISVDDNRAVSNECTNALVQSNVIVRVCVGVGTIAGYRHLPVFSRKITNLTGFRTLGVAMDNLASDERVQVGLGAGAVSIGWDWLIMDVVGEWATHIRQPVNGDYNFHTLIWCRAKSNPSTDPFSGELYSICLVLAL